MKRLFVIGITIIISFSALSQTFELTSNNDRKEFQFDINGFRHFIDTTKIESYHVTSLFTDTITHFDFKRAESRTKILKTKKNDYEIIINSWVVNPDGKWNWSDILKFKLEVSDQEIKVNLDKSYQPMKLTEGQIDSVLSMRSKLLSDLSFTEINSDNFDKAKADVVEDLASRIFLCTIYGDDNCYKAFKTLSVDFPILQLGVYSELFTTYEGILREKERN